MAETGKIEIGTSTLNIAPTFSNATKTSGDYNSLDNLPTLNGATIKGDKTNPELGIVKIATALTTTTINGYVVPQFTATELTDIYNAFVAGKHVIVSNPTGTERFAVNQADYISDELCVSILYYNKMLLCYKVENSTVTIDYTEIVEIPTITISLSQVISQEPLKVQLTSEQATIVENDEYSFVKVDMGAFGSSTATMSKGLSNDRTEVYGSWIGLGWGGDDREINLITVNTFIYTISDKTAVIAFTNIYGDNQ